VPTCYTISFLIQQKMLYSSMERLEHKMVKCVSITTTPPLTSLGCYSDLTVTIIVRNQFTVFDIIEIVLY